MSHRQTKAGAREQSKRQTLTYDEFRRTDDMVRAERQNRQLWKKVDFGALGLGGEGPQVWRWYGSEGTIRARRAHGHAGHSNSKWVYHWSISSLLNTFCSVTTVSPFNSGTNTLACSHWFKLWPPDFELHHSKNVVLRRVRQVFYTSTRTIQLTLQKPSNHFSVFLLLFTSIRPSNIHAITLSITLSHFPSLITHKESAPNPSISGFYQSSGTMRD